MPNLVVIKGRMKGQSFKFYGDTLFLGRSSRNDIQIEDAMISRKHLKVFRIGNKFFVEDLKSTNGTMINGKLIEAGESYEIEEGDSITTGNTVIQMNDLPIKNALEVKKITLKKSDEEKKTSNDRRSQTSKDLNLLFKISELLKQSLNINVLFEKALEYILDTLPRIDTAAILLFYEGESKGENLKSIVSKSRKDLPKETPYCKSVVKQVMKEGKAVRMSDTWFENPDDFTEDMDTLEIGSLMCVPMVSSSKTHGAIYIHSIRGPYAFRKGDMKLLNMLSSSIAVAIEKNTLSSQLGEIPLH